MAIYKATKINSTKFDISLVSKWVTDDGPIAIEVNDADDVDSMFCVGMKVIELYVKKKRVVQISEQQAHIFDYTSQPRLSNTAEQSQMYYPYNSSQRPNIYAQTTRYCFIRCVFHSCFMQFTVCIHRHCDGYGMLSGFGFMLYPPQSIPTSNSNECL